MLTSANKDEAEINNNVLETSTVGSSSHSSSQCSSASEQQTDSQSQVSCS